MGSVLSVYCTWITKTCSQLINPMLICVHIYLPVSSCNAINWGELQKNPSAVYLCTNMSNILNKDLAWSLTCIDIETILHTAVTGTMLDKDAFFFLKFYWRLTNNKMVYYRQRLVWSVDLNDILSPFLQNK